MPRIVPVLLLLLSGASAIAAPPDAAGDEYFEKEIRPLLVAHCLKCHGDGKKVEGGLSLTSRTDALAGGASGPAVVPGKPADSLLVQVLQYQPDNYKMPPKGKLPAEDIARFTRWVRMGAPWPDSKAKPVAAGAKFVITDAQRRFWAFQPVRAVAPPKVKDAAWPRSDLDRFILAGLEAQGLAPAEPLDKRRLIRRATFDLTGLPPTPEEVEAFVADPSPDAFAKVVDRLLASPAYGERWGRHWLDVVRYADSRDSRGMGGAEDIAEAWRYRDYVVAAFNADKPYDRFVVEQIAGDRLPAAKPGELNAEGLIATGLLTIGEWGTGDADKEKMLTDVINDQVDVVSRAFLGLTVACARCHDHKFDPIAQADYYGLAGIFFSTHILPNPGPKTNGSPLLRTPLLSPAQLAERGQRANRLRDLEAQVRQTAERHAAQLARDLLPQTARYVLAAHDYLKLPAGRPTLEAFAAKQGLHAFALKQWLNYLGAGDYRPMSQSVRDADGVKGMHAWRGAADCPNLLVNTNDHPVKHLTFTLPAKSVAVHPGPKSGVVVRWQAPIDGTVRIAGRVADADPAGGDGIAWRFDHRPATGGRAELGTGDIPNGGGQRFDQGRSAERLNGVAVKAGDALELVVSPKSNHTCDTTVVEWRIEQVDGPKQVWNLTRDLVADPLRGNPNGVWQFLDTVDDPARPAADSALVAWRRASATAADRAALERAAADFQKAFARAAAQSPFWPRTAEAEQSLPAPAREELAKRRRELDALRRTSMEPVPMALAAREGGTPGSMYPGIQDVHIHIRGSYTRLGERVPRHFPTILAGEKQAPIASGSGRLELARWIASGDHPLTARVMVNRVWQYHFGEGIVRTPSNFGKLGDRPSHPELLDYLADRFVRGGWSVKQLHRLILLSATYQQSGTATAEALRRDPDNRWFGRVVPRRLEAEEVRDSLLAVAGRLDRTRGGPSVADLASPRRTLYLRTTRSDRGGFVALFDGADPETSVEKRTVSTVAPQALFLLNHPFALDQARALARRVTEKAKGNDPAGIDVAYRLLYGRPPTAAEAEVGRAFLKGAGASAWEEYAQVLLCGNEFLYVD